MFPIRDDAPRSTTPFINYFLIVLNIGIFLFEWSLQFTGGPRARADFEMQFAFVPQHVAAWMKGYLPAAVAFVPFLSSMFLHASLPHVLLNMWGLAIFGDNVEDRLGHFSYLVLYPRARVLTWWGFFVFWLPAWLVLGYWLIVNLLSGAASVLTVTNGPVGGVAFWAHVGGFITGAVLIRLMPTRKNVYAFEDY